MELPTNFSPSTDETPFYCLLEDDNLIANLSIKTGRLLEPVASSIEVLLVIHVFLKTTRATIDYFALGI
jgi:hypothetical protein